MANNYWKFNLEVKKNKDLIPKSNIISWFSELATDPYVQALCQLHPVSAAINALLSGEYNRKKTKEITEFLHRVYLKLKSIEKKYVDKDFYSTPKGKRVFATAIISVIKDSRRKKIKAMSNLLVNLTLKTKITYDERELFVDILDALNPFHLTVLARIYKFNKESKSNLKRFEPTGIADFFKDKGIDPELTHQAIAVLTNHYLVNRGTNATIGGGGLAYHFTPLGERFFEFISGVLDKNSAYLNLST